ncbi:MAG TPA: hypothetical protein PKA63_00395 [Oligoflexia bacterium]|nr:hypothetical protein [Oligoflexia bacterium]HMP47108.1 hypothetical protein [Oligoflexia bacterium]
MKQRIILAGVVVISFFILIFLSQNKNYAIKHNTATAFSSNSSGLSIFHDFASLAFKEKLFIQKGAFLNELDLREISTIIIFSPKLPISEREILFLSKFVKEGGVLLLSATSKNDFDLYSGLFSSLGIKASAKDYPDYKWGKLEGRREDDESIFFREDEEYEFYSSIHVSVSSPKPVRSEVFSTSIKVDNGYVELYAGLPLISNSMIGRSDNRNIAMRILEREGRIVIDEYRHHFTEKTVSDLLKTPSFFVPIFGMCLLVFVFLLFSDPGHLEYKKRIIDRNVSQYHDLNYGVLLGLWKSKGLMGEAVRLQGKYISKKFPNRSGDVELLAGNIDKADIDEQSVLNVAKKLLLIHKKELRDRGIG